MVCGFLLLVAFLWGAGRAVALVPAVRQLLLVGSVATSGGGSRGAVVIFSFDPAVERTATAAAGLVSPVASAITPDGRLYIADPGADPLRLHGSLGAVWLVDPAAAITAPVGLAVANPLFRKLADLLLQPDGTILLLDSDADPNEWGQRNGALFRIDPATGNVSVLAAPQAFREPRSLTIDLDGSILVVDEAANPQRIPDPAGAIFRVNPDSGTVTLERFFVKGDRRSVTAPTAVAVIKTGARRGDYLLVDRDADPFGRATAPGAVFRLPRSGGAPELFSTTEVVEFVEPVDILIGLDEDVFVLDRVATTPRAALGKGAVFHFRLSDGVLLQSPKVSNNFRNLNSFTQLSGAQVDSSRVAWTDETPPVLKPGDFLTVRARVRNTGTADAPGVSLVDTVRAPFQFVLGSDSVGTGRASFDARAQRFSWVGALPQGDSTKVRFRLKISESAPIGERVQQRLHLHAGESHTTFARPFTPQGEFGQGEFGTSPSVFLDVVPPVSGGAATGVIYVVGDDRTRPDTLSRGGLLVRPADSVFLEDGRLVVLDPGSRVSPGGELGAILVHTFNSIDTLSVLLALRRELGFVRPAGLALDRDGTLLIIDMDANPQGYPYTPADPFNPDPGPGAIFRFNVMTRSLSVAATNSGFHEPVDAVVDRRGALVVVDYVGGRERQGALWELIPGGTTREIELDAGLFKTPTGVVADAANDLYVCSFRSRAGPNPRGGAIYKVHRGLPVTVSVASADSALREPVDLAVQSDGSLLIADRAANPLHLPAYDRGAVFRLDPLTGVLAVAAASGLLREPDGVVSLGWPDLGGSRLTFRSSAPGDPQPGDTLWAEAQVVNTGLRSAPQSMAVLSFSRSTLHVLPVDPPIAGLTVDTLSNHAVWTGRVAGGDTVRLAVPGIVLPGSSYGSLAEVKLSVQGGRSSALASVSRPIRSSFLPDDLLLVDNAADPRQLGGPYGAVFRLGQDPFQACRLVCNSPANVAGLAAAEWTAAGELILAADRGDGAPGAVYRFDTVSGRLLQYGQGDMRLKTPVDLLFAPSGDLLVVDRDAQEQGPTAPSRGAIFSQTGTGPLSVYCADSLFRAPLQAAFGPEGMLYLADPAANPEGGSGNTGAVFTIDPVTRKVVGWLQDPLLPEPTGVTAYDDSTLLISDPLGSNPSSPRGTLTLYRPQGRVRTRPLIALSSIQSLWRSLRTLSGELLLLDRLGQHAGQTGLGLVRGYDPASNRFSEFAWCDSFVRISDLVAKPGPAVRFTRYDWSDPNGPPLNPADLIHWRAVVRNIGVAEASGEVYRDSLPAEAAIMPETAESNGGQGPLGVIRFEGSRALNWSGSIPAGDSVVISYDVRLNPAVSEGRLLLFHPTVSGPTGGTLDKTVKLQTHVPLEQGCAYLIDADADPFGESGTGQLGALFKVNLTTGAVVPMFTSRFFRRPISLALVGNPTAPRFLILDGLAVNQYGRIGTLFLFDPFTRELRNLGGHREFKDPRKVLAWTETTALVLDARADPDTLYVGPRTGPGAVFKVNLQTDAFTPVFSDTTLKMPVSMTWLESGILAVSDEKADPNGPDTTGTGAIYRIDLARRELRVFATSRDWRTPSGVCSDLHGGLLVVDRDATPYDASGGYGSVYKVTAQGSIAKVALSRYFAVLRDVQAELDGDPLVIDEQIDPYGWGGSPGAILRWMAGGFRPLSSSPMFRTPSGLVIYGDPTPVDLLEAAADSTGEGIRLRWRAGADESGAQWLVFRRVAAGPGDPGDAAPEGYDPVGGDHDFRGAGPHEYVDRGVEGGRWYVYLVARVTPSGVVDYSAPLLAHAPGGVVRLELLAAVPSPFSGRTNFAFLVPAPGGQVRLAVFDVVGRRVRVLCDGPAAAGRHTSGWDGRDDAGRRLASGVYFARLSLGDESRSRRLVLMR
jgi:sugar lactone lactonase YvrE